MDITQSPSLQRQREKFCFNADYTKDYKYIAKYESKCIFSNSQPSGTRNKSDIYGAKCLNDIFLEIYNNIDESNQTM